MKNSKNRKKRRKGEKVKEENFELLRDENEYKGIRQCSKVNNK